MSKATGRAVMAVTGGCMCGAIRYRAEGEPVHNALCHCTDCRRAAGAPIVGWALFPLDAVEVTGTPLSYSSSPDVERQFCGTCGTGLFFRSSTMFPNQVDIQIGTLDDPDDLPPTACIQVADAPSWLNRIADLPRFERYPGQ